MRRTGPSTRWLTFVKYVRRFGEPATSDSRYAKFHEDWDAAFGATAHVNVDGPPSVHVLLNGKDDVGTTPLPAPLDVLPGKYFFESAGPDKMRSAEVDATLGTIVKAVLAPVAAPPAPSTTGVQAPQPPGPGEPLGPVGSDRVTSTRYPLRTWGEIAGGVGVASLVAGVYFAVKAGQDSNDAQNILSRIGSSGCANPANSSDCQTVQSDRSDQSRDSTLQWVFLGAGAALVVTGGVLFFLPQGSDKVSLLPVVAPHASGLQLRGEF
jgi:hypothetical protein